MTERTIPLYARSVLKTGSNFFSGVINAVGGVITTLIEVSGSETVTGLNTNNGNLVVCGNVTINGDIDIGGSLNVAGSTLTPMPSGSIMPYAGGTGVPAAEWLLCDGAGYSTTTYSDLFNAIGYTYGGAGATFNVPDLRGRLAVGQDLGAGRVPSAVLGTTGGNQVHPLTESELPSHSHTGSVTSNIGEGVHSHVFNTTGTTAPGGNHSHAASGTGGDHTHTLNYTLTEGRDYAGAGESWNTQTCTFENIFFSEIQGVVDISGPYPTTGHVTGGGGHSHTFFLSPGTTSTEAIHTHPINSVTDAGTSTAHNNVQPYIILNYVIKT